MNITQEKTGDLTATIKVEVSPEDYKSQVNEVLRDYARKANIKGFRKGKVPVSVIKRMYGKSVVVDELNKLLTEKVQGYIKDEKLNIVGDPIPVPVDEINLDVDSSDEQTFEYEIGLAPDFSLNLETDNRPPKYDISIDDETLNEEIESIQKRYGDMSNPEVAQEGDILYGKIMELDSEGNVVEEGLSRMMALNPERVPSEEVKKSFDGKKPEDTFKVNMLDVLKDEDEVRRFWQTNVQGEQVREVGNDQLQHILDAEWQFEVRKINRMESVELSEELYKKVFPNDEITDEEGFRQRVSDDLKDYIDRQAEQFYKAKTVRALVEGNEMPLPDAFLRRWLIQTDQRVTEDNVERYFKDYAVQLRWSLIIDHLQSNNEELRVSEEDMKARATDVVRREVSPYMPGATDEQIEAYANHYLRDEKMAQRVFQEALDHKIFAYIDEQSPAPSESVTAAEFMDIVKKDNETNMA